jgi:hypothetical protein
MQAVIDLDFVDWDRRSKFDQLGFGQRYVDQLCFGWLGQDQRLKLRYHFLSPDLVERSDHCYAAPDRSDLVGLRLTKGSVGRFSVAVH